MKNEKFYSLEEKDLNESIDKTIHTIVLNNKLYEEVDITTIENLCGALCKYNAQKSRINNFYSTNYDYSNNNANNKTYDEFVNMVLNELSYLEYEINECVIYWIMSTKCEDKLLVINEICDYITQRDNNVLAYLIFDLIPNM